MTFALAVLILGGIAYCVDAVYGKELFRKFHKATHAKDSTPPVDAPGFVVGRTVKGRVLSALILSAALTFILSISTAHSLIGLIWSSVVVFVMLMLGFTVAAVVHRRFDPAKKVAKVVEVLDGLESGSIDPTKKAREAIQKVAEKVSELRANEVATPGPAPEEAAQSTDISPEPPVAPRRSLEEKLNDYAKRR